MVPPLLFLRLGILPLNSWPPLPWEISHTLPLFRFDSFPNAYGLCLSGTAGQVYSALYNKSNLQKIQAKN